MKIPARLQCLQLGRQRVVWTLDTSWRRQSKPRWCCLTPQGQQPEERHRRTDWHNQTAGRAPGSHQMFPEQEWEHRQTQIKERQKTSFDFWLKITCTDQVRAHVGLQPDLLYQRKLFLLIQSSLLDFANHLFVASPLQPVGQEGLHELIQDLTGDQQGRQTLERAQTQRNINRNQGRGRWEKQKKGTVKTRGAERWEVESKKERRRQTYLSEKLHVLHDKGNVEERRETVEEVELKKKKS